MINVVFASGREGISWQLLPDLSVLCIAWGGNKGVLGMYSWGRGKKGVLGKVQCFPPPLV